MKCHVIFYLFGAYSSVKVNKSVYVAKLGQRCDKTLNNFLLHVPNHALKDMDMLNYVTIKIQFILWFHRGVILWFHRGLELLMVA